MCERDIYFYTFNWIFKCTFFTWHVWRDILFMSIFRIRNENFFECFYNMYSTYVYRSILKRDKYNRFLVNIEN